MLPHFACWCLPTVVGAGHHVSREGVSSSFSLGGETAERTPVLDSVSRRMSDAEEVLLLFPVSKEPGSSRRSFEKAM